MYESLARRVLPAILLFLLTAERPAEAREKRGTDPLEGITADVLENGETMYQPRAVPSPVLEIFLGAFMVRSVTGTRSLLLGVTLHGVGEDVLAPLVLSIDGTPVSLPLKEHPMIDSSGCRPSATQTIRDDADLVRRISRAKEVRITYQSPGIRLESTLAPEDLERFRRIIRLFDREELPPAPKTADNPPQDPELSFELPEGISHPELIPSTKVAPVYPPEAFAQQKSGRVILKARILKDGTIGTLRPVTAYPLGCGFVEAAIEAVRKWKYVPAKKKDKPVEVDFGIMVDFVFSEADPRVARAETPVVNDAGRGL